MDATELRAMQAPIKDRYKSDPGAALITLKAKGSLDDQNIACKVETGRALAVAGLHPATGGSGMELCSGDMLLEALVACAGVTAEGGLDRARHSAEVRHGVGRRRSRFPRHARRRQGGPGRVPRRSGSASTSTPTRRRTSSISCSSSPSAIAWSIRPSPRARRWTSRCSGVSCHARTFSTSWPGLSRPSTSCLVAKKGVDARHKAGHDAARR